MSDAPTATEHCSICGEGPDPDLRLVAIRTGYDMTEAGLERLELGLQTSDGRPYPLYGCEVCKECRGDLIGAMRVWRQGGFRKVHELARGSGDEPRNIPVRIDGTTRMLTASEYAERYPGRQPHVFVEPPEPAPDTSWVRMAEIKDAPRDGG